MTDFIYPPSIQSDLFSYLKPEQQKVLKPILRLVKRPYQQMLCACLLDYLKGNGFIETEQPVLDQMARSIINELELNR